MGSGLFVGWVFFLLERQFTIRDGVSVPRPIGEGIDEGAFLEHVGANATRAYPTLRRQYIHMCVWSKT